MDLDETTNESVCDAAQRRVRAVFLPHNAPNTRRFAPRDQLYKFLTQGSPSWARRILECPCAKCSGHRRSRGPSSTIEANLKDILGADGNSSFPRRAPRYNSSAIALFSLFVAVGYPAYITVLLNMNINDSSLQSGLEDAYNRLADFGKWDGKMSRNHYDYAFTALLQRSLPLFATPHFENSHYVEFDANTVLPFIDEEHIGRLGPDGKIEDEGGYSKVYGFRIYDCYNELQVCLATQLNCHIYGWLPSHFVNLAYNWQEKDPLVRKELLDTVPLEYLVETKNLHTVDELRSDYIVKLVKTYKHGERFNIVFRREKADLNHYLRDENWQSEAENLRKGPLESCSIWRHALGITEALGKISRIEIASDPHRKISYNGFHFDLKPANVLVSDSTWLISDFGIARFEQANGATSRVMNIAGTDAYAPPELMNVTEKFSRRYDVWSLGCILLEVTVFAIGGQTFLAELDKIRRTTTDHLTDHRFFVKIPGRSQEFEVKPSIVKFKDSLKQQSKASPHPARTFLQQLLDLIDNMLQPNADDRWDISKVVPELKRIVSSAQDPRTPKVQYPDPDPDEGEDDTTPQRLRNMKLFHHNKDGSTRARLYTFRRITGSLRIAIADPTHQERPWPIELNERIDRIVPLYMYPPHGQDRVSFERFDTGGLHASTFEFSDRDDAQYFHSHMTHQKIVGGPFELQGIRIFRPSALPFNLFRKKESTEFSESLGKAIVQLWTEDLDAFEAARTGVLQKSSGTRSLPMRTRPQEHVIPVRRLVIYAGDRTKQDNPLKIISIVVTGAIRYVMDRERPPPPDLALNTTRFIPNKPSEDRYISIAVIRPLQIAGAATPMPSIPLDVTTLRREELKEKFDCKKIEFTFADEPARRNFERAFNGFHKERHLEKEDAERAIRPGKTHHGRGGSGNVKYHKELTIPSSSGTSVHSRDKGKAKAEDHGEVDLDIGEVDKPKRKMRPNALNLNP